MKMITSLIGLALLNVSLADEVNLSKVLKKRNELMNLNKSLHTYLYNAQTDARLKSWINHPENKDRMISCANDLRAYVKAPKILNLICHQAYQQDKEKSKKTVGKLLDRMFIEQELIYHELKNDPRYSKAENNQAEEIEKKFTQSNKELVKTCFEKFVDLPHYLQTKNASAASTGFVSKNRREIQDCFDSLRSSGTVRINLNVNADISTRPLFFAVEIQDVFSHHPGHAISESGWIEGNKVTYLTENKTDQDFLLLMKKSNDLIPDLYSMNGEGTISSLINKDLDNVFTSSEGFYTPDNDPNWNQKSGIFHEIMKEVNQAKETIFVDIFFMGGTMGVSMAKKLIEKAREGVKVVILRDNKNHFGYADQMLPVFNYLYSFMMNQHEDSQIQKNGGYLVVAQSYIEEHKSGLPKLLTQIQDDEFLQMVEFFKHLPIMSYTGLEGELPLDPKAYSDHSKVMVIDGKTKSPIAFVGSKNWLDKSGALCWDEVAKIEGPAAAVTQDDFYHDMFYALKNYKVYTQKGYEDSMKSVLQKLLPSETLKENKTRSSRIVQLLKPFDLLDRSIDKYGYFSASSKKVSYPKHATGKVMLRTGYNNYNSTRTNAIDQVIQGILKAERSIYIKDQYIFDRRIVNALVLAKRANPRLTIKVIVGNFLPNYLYADILENENIEVKFKNYLKDDVIAQEYHMKTVSMDSKFVITGSANKDQTTMYGAFREQQVDIFDMASAAEHDRTFDNMFNDDQSTIEFTNFENLDSEELDSIQGLLKDKGIEASKTNIISYIRNILSILYDTVHY